MSDSTKVMVTMQQCSSPVEIESWLKEHWQLYRDALDLTGDYFDRKSQVESIEIKAVEILGEKVEITYQVQYSGFRPCQDLQYKDKATRRITGLKSNQTIVFPKYEPLERRSTADEL